jgi:2,4-dienoyl-CoA reductase-like NADH-dependent reductase (Old Yellow Enzyme family)
MVKRRSPLLSPLRLGPVEIPNRIVSTAHQTSLVHGGVPTAEFVAYHTARARGGVGLIVLEAVTVHPSGALSSHAIAGYDERIVPVLGQLAVAVHARGGRLFAQLFHGGRENFQSPPREPVVAPSAVPSPRFRTEPRALTSQEIEEVVAAHEDVASRCRRAGLDGLELCASHGYLPSQFLNPRTNRREDAWGGDEERRLAYTRAALAAIRRGAGSGLAVGIRLSADERLPEGRDLEAGARILHRLAQDGLIDYASIVIGDSAEHVGSMYIVPPPPVPRAVISELAGPLRTRLPVPLIAATRIHDPEEGERLISAGVADAVGMNRALIADPRLPALTAEGRADERIACVVCNLCIARYHLGLPIRCLQNERTGREAHLPEFPVRDAVGLSVAVVGAGPAGLAAAEAAALRGASVTLLERAQRIGGQLELAGRAPGHAETAAAFIADRRRRLDAAGVDLRLAVEVDADNRVIRSAEVVIVATGARPHRPSLPPAEGCLVLDGWTALRQPDAVPGPVLVADWGGGSAGLDVAEVLALAGREVTLAVAAPAIGDTVHQYARTAYLGRLEQLGVTLLHHRGLDPTGNRLALRSIWTHRREPLPAGIAAVVIAHGREPEDALLRDLAGAGLDVLAAGDCRGPRSAEEAVLEGSAAGRGVATRSRQ